jgi:hypothetical protein
MALCSASSNPLTQFTKYLRTDRELQRDRLVVNKNGTRCQGLRNTRRQVNQEVRMFSSALTEDQLAYGE